MRMTYESASRGRRAPFFSDLGFSENTGTNLGQKFKLKRKLTPLSLNFCPREFALAFLQVRALRDLSENLNSQTTWGFAISALSG